MRRAMALVALSIGVAGCTGSLFQSKVAPPAVYLLSARAPAAAGDGKPAQAPAAALAVLRPSVRAGLDNDHVAALYPDRRLDYFAGARWSAPLDEIVQNLAVDTFRSGGLRGVSTDASAFPAGFWLELDVIDFQAEYAVADGAPTVRVRLDARLGGASDRRVIGRFAAAASVAAQDNRLTAIIDAYERAANEAFAQLREQTFTALRSGGSLAE